MWILVDFLRIFVDFAVDCCGWHVSLCLVVSFPNHPVSLGPRSGSAAPRVVSSNSSFSSLFPSRPRPCACLHPHRYHHPIHHVVIFMPLVSAHPSRALWPHRELHRTPQWQGSHGGPAPFWRTPHTVRGPIGSSTEGPRGKARIRDRVHCGTPLTRFVAP